MQEATMHTGRHLLRRSHHTGHRAPWSAAATASFVAIFVPVTIGLFILLAYARYIRRRRRLVHAAQSPTSDIDPNIKSNVAADHAAEDGGSLAADATVKTNSPSPIGINAQAYSTAYTASDEASNWAAVPGPMQNAYDSTENQQQTAAGTAVQHWTVPMPLSAADQYVGGDSHIQPYSQQYSQPGGQPYGQPFSQTTYQSSSSMFATSTTDGSTSSMMGAPPHNQMLQPSHAQMPGAYECHFGTPVQQQVRPAYLHQAGVDY